MSGGGAAHFIARSGKTATRPGSSILTTNSPWLAGLRRWARVLKRDAAALWIAARDPRAPLAAGLALAAYVRGQRRAVAL